MFIPRRILRVALVACIVIPVGTTLQSQEPDNSAHNKAHRTTADTSSNAASDRDIMQKIRKAVVADKSLSTYGHNCKIIAQNGMVTLKGPVHSDDEKTAIVGHAAEIVGKDHVTDNLTVKP